ncbi:MAG: choice-of-anchor D domain-containing protein [Paludibacteraceae bacterium]|nr:choice-of-anchor D domain-containing protein [Paludibacteraceae bacterium]
MKHLINYLSKKSLSLENGSRMVREWFEIDSAKSRKSIGSNLSRLCLASLICLCMLTVGVGNAWADETWDLTTNSYSSSSTSTVTWSGTNATMTLEKNGGTNANNYLGGSGSYTHTRVYSKNILRITPASGQTIASIKITATSSSYTITGTWTNGSASTSGSVTTVTPTDGTKAVYCTCNATKRLSEVVVTFAAAASCTTSPTVGAGSNSAVTATGATVSCTAGITSLGSAGCTISSYGFVYGTATSPTLTTGTQVQKGTAYTTTGTAFSHSLTGLTSGTTYYVRPYATNGNGTAYGTQTLFTTLNVPTLTLDKTGIGFGDKANGGGPYTAIFTVAGSHLTSNISIAITGANAALFSVDKTSISYGSGTVAATTVTVSYTPTSAGSHSATITVSSTGATSKTISLSGTSKYTYTWMKNGAVHATTLVASGTKPTFPADPTSCDDVSTTFIGWTNAEWTGKIDDVSAKTIHETNSTMSNASANKTFYAVFAKEGAGGTTTKTYSFTIDADDFNTTSYAANNNEKTTTATATDASGATIDVDWTSNQVMKSGTNMQWQKSNGYIYNSTDLGTVNSVTVTSSAGTFTTYYGTSANPSSGTQGSGKGYFKTSVGGATGTTSKVVVNFTKSSSGGVTYSKYLTNCCTSLGTVSATLSAVSGTTANFTWSAVTGAEKYQVKVVGSSSHNAWTDATSGVTVSGLTAGSSYTAYFRAIDTNGSHCSESEETSKAFTTPKLTVSPTTITGLNYPVGSGPSEAQSFTVSGVGLTGNVTITAPTNFEVSKTSATSGFGSSVTLTPSSGTISTQTIWVRLASGLAQNTYGASNVTVAGGSATTINVSVTGTVSSACEDPTINTHPAAATYNLNATATALSVTATKNGTGPALTYQWYSNTANNNTTGSAILSATSSSYTPPTTAAGTKYYYCVVSSGACETATNTATITVRTPSITVSKTSIAYGDQARGEGHTETFTVSGTNLASGQGLSLALSGTNNAMFSIDKTSVAQTSAGAVATTTITVTYTPSSNGAHSATITVSSTGAESKTIALSGTGKWKVEWMRGDASVGTALVANSSKVAALPTTPADNALGSCANKFMGWSRTDIGNTPVVSAPADLFTDVAGSPSITANTTFYAVYATASGSETPSSVTSTFTSKSWADASSLWTSGKDGNGLTSGRGVQVTTGSSGANATTKSSYSKVTSVVVTYSTNASSGAGSIAITVGGTSMTASASVSTTGGTSDRTITYTPTSPATNLTGVVKIAVTCSTNSLYIKSVKINYTTGSATYSDYVTKCCTDWTAPTLTYSVPSGWKAGDADVNATVGGGTTHGAVSFESSNTDVLTVNASTGKIHAVGAGTATVTATWAGDATYCEKSRTSATITVTGNVTITFKMNGGGGTDNKTQSVVYNTATALTSLATLGYTAPSCKQFKGWATSEANATAGTIAYADGANITATAGTTLWATWETINYTVTKGTGTGAATFTLSPASSVACGGTITVSATPDASHKGSPVVTISPADAGTVSGTNITSVTKNITVNVSFAAKETYTVTWSANGAELTGGALGSAPTSVTEGNAIGTLPPNPTSCSDEYSSFVGWYAYEAGTESDPTTPATFASSAGDKVTTATVPTGNVTYYAVFSDGSAAGYELVTNVSGINDDDEYIITNSATTGAGYAMSTTQNSNNRGQVACDNADFETLVQKIWIEKTISDQYILYTNSDKTTCLNQPSANNYLRTKTFNYGSECYWTISITSNVATITNAGYNYQIRRNSGSSCFSCYDGTQQSVYLYRVGAAGTGYISSCGTNIKIDGNVKITAANGMWVEGNSMLTLTGTNMTDNAANVTVVVKVTEGGTSKWRVKDGTAGTTGQGGTAGLSFTDITSTDWTRNIAVTYTPAAANVTEEATITVLVKAKGASDAAAFVTKTVKVYGRSLPSNFLIAVNDGTLADGHWYAIPADMIAPYGSTCSSGLGTYKPIPITVDNNTNPTKATVAPARAVYQPVQRSSVTTSPQTLRFKSKTLSSGGTVHYLYGGGTGGEGTTNNTHIQNATFADSEKQKWFMESEDLQKYTVHLASGITTNVLGYTTAGGANRVGQYAAGVATTKKDIWFLPFDVSECVFLPAPDVTGVSLDATNYTIQFPKDRLATAWQISTDGGSSWVALPNKSEIACSGSVETPTTVQSVLPMATYRGQEVKIKVSVPSATCGTNIATFTVPNPVITVNGATPWHLYGITGQAFDDQTQTITLSGLYEGVGAATNVASSNPAIHAELVAPIANGEVHVRLTMTAGAATAGDHETVLTFTSTGAETKTRTTVITMQTLAGQSFTKLGAYFSGDLLCKNSDLSVSTNYVFKMTNPAYKSAGVLCTLGEFNSSDLNLYDVSTGEKVNSKSFPRTMDGSGYVSFSFSNHIGDMVEGKKYRLVWTNTDQAVKNSTGVPYQDVSYTFTYGDCSKPIALQPCPIGTTSFTANWIPSGSSAQTFNAYYYELGISICDVTYTSSSAPKLYYSQASNYAATENAFFSLLYGASWSSPSSTMCSWQSDSYGGWRMCNTSKRWALFSKQCTTAGTYTVTFKGRAVSYANNVTVYKTDQYGEPIGGALGVYELASSGVTTVSLQVALTSGQRIAIVPDLSVSSSKGVVAAIALSVKQVGAKHYVGSTPAAGIASSINNRTVTGLTAGTTYYYTINNGSESNEVSVTTRSGSPEIDFSPGKAVLQADKDGSVSTTINLDGSNITLCELEGLLGGTNASYFSVSTANAVYNQTTGALSGYLTITYSPTTTGNHTATYTIDGVTLQLEGHACPAGFGSSLATAATLVTESSARANWSTNTTGYFMLAENQRMNTELLANGGFEEDGLEWDGVPNTMLPTKGSRSNELNAAMKRSGSKGLYARYNGNGSYLYQYNSPGTGATIAGAVYGEKQTLPAGTYTISAYVHGAGSATSLNAFPGSDQMFYVGFATDFPTFSQPNGRKAVGPLTGTNVNGKSIWVKVEDTFTLTEPTSGYIFIGNSHVTGSNHAIDDVSLKCTGIVPGNNFSEYPISSVRKYDLTGLKPSTSYSYYVVNGDGCASNIISFTTTSSGVAPTITATPNPLTIQGPKGTTTKSTISITAENAYSTILLSVAGACGGRISVSPTSFSSAGGLAVVSFTPLEGDAEGASGSCTISATTLGIAAPYDITINWSVAAGLDVNTEMIEVVELSNADMTVEHNIEGISDNSEIHIVLERELAPDEIEENVGDEIFFSKYYEAFMHKKLWAIFNPTNEKISLKGMQVWRSAGGSAGTRGEWNRTDVVDLSQYGQEKGFIGPQEEIIIYASQNTYTCEQERVDMSDWFGYPNSGPLSYSGDDALLLVRKVRTGDADYRTPPAVSVAGDALTWRSITDDDDTEWTMLDIIGARTKSNMPDGSGLKGGWTWHNCKSGTTEAGDDNGWVGYGRDIADDAWSSNTCSGETGGYLLSTNRCLLIRQKNVKSGNNAVNVNVGNMYTLGISPIQSEWQGAHVPTTPAAKQDEISCENFSFIGGYDYAGYYNRWTPLNDDEYAVGERRDDGSYLVSDVNVPRFWCNTVRIEIVEKETVNGVEIENVRKFQDYKVPIVVDEDAYTNTAKFFGAPNNPTYSGAEDNQKKGQWSSICAECDVVVRDNAKLTHRTGSNVKNEFHNMQVYSGSKLDIPSGLTLTLNGLQMRGVNDEVSYAIINNGEASISVDTIVHVKRIDDAHWYRFSLPYDCDIATIRQLNGKAMGIYGTDWVIKYYDGAERQAQDNFAGVGVSSKHWKKLTATDRLNKHQGYIIGLYTTEWEGQSKSVYFPPRNPNATYGYTEGGAETKTANVYAYTGDGNQMNRGWNFVGSPFISLFNPAGQSAANQGMNNSSVMIMGQYDIEEYKNTDRVYVSVPTDAGMRYYEQREAASEKLEPFLPYFVQVAGTVAETKTISYAKGGRTLTKAPRRERQAEENQHVGFDLMIVAQDSTFDVAGIALSDDYEIGYEAERDLYKMTRSKNQTNFYTIAPDQEKMAFIALPMSNATDIPLGIYVPEIGKYTIMVTPGSDLTDIDAIYLKYYGEQVANLLFDEYELDAEGYGDIDGFTVTVVVRKRVPTEVEIATMDEVGVLLTPAGIEVVGLPQGAEVQLVDVVGRTLAQQKTTDESVQFNAPATGVYNIVVRYGNEQKVIKTVIK